jgi:hypothetical protein
LQAKAPPSASVLLEVSPVLPASACALVELLVELELVELA